MPRSASSSALFKRVTVELPAAEAEALAARAEAAGVPVGAILRGDQLAHAQELATAVDRLVADERRTAGRRLAQLQRDHAKELAQTSAEADERIRAAQERVQADVNAAYQQGLAEADPALQLQHQVDQLELRRYGALFDAYEDYRHNLGRAVVDEVLTYLKDRGHRKYAEAVHELLKHFDQMLDRALRPIPQADGGWLDRHERETQAKQRAAIARAEREAHADRTQTSELIRAQLDAAVADGDKRARDELAPEVVRLQAALDDALAKLADLGPIREERDGVTAELVNLNHELVEAGWAGREAYVNAIMENLRKLLADRLPIASPDQYRIP